MEVDQLPPKTATVLAFGKYEPRNGERVVELPTMAKLYTQCNTISMIALAFERAVVGENRPQFRWEITDSIHNVSKGVWHVDIETRGDADKQIPSWKYIISMSITVAEQDGYTYVLPEEYVQGHQQEITEALNKVADLVVFHNGKFDTKYTGTKYDEDTMLMHYSIFPNAPQGLKELGKYYLGISDWDAPAKKHLGKLKAPQQRELNEKGIIHLEDGAYMTSDVEYTASNGYERIPRQELYEYNAIDTYVTWLLYELMRDRWFLKPEYQYARSTYEMLLDYADMFRDIESQGIRYDVDYMSELETILEAEKTQLELELNEIVGQEINPRSPQQVKAALIERGWRVSSTSEDTLKTINDPMAQKVLEIRHVTKQLGTYVSGYKKQLIDSYGYPGFKLTASTTGRIGGAGASLLTLPRDKKMKRMVLPDENQVIVGADLSQAELRVMACESGDQMLIDAFAPDAGDFFDILLSQAYEDFDRDAEDYEEVRTSMKSVVYGASFARGVPAIATQLGIPVEEAQMLMDTFIVPGSDFHKWRTDISAKAKLAKPIDTKFGRRYVNETVMFYNSGNIGRTGLSFTSQATANDICLQAAHRLWDSGIITRKYGGRILSTLHDAIYCSVPEEYAEEVGELIVGTLQMVGKELYGDVVPFTSDWDYGANLAELD